MRAAVLTEDRPRLELAEVDEPRPAAGEVVIEVTACGICGSDLHVAGVLGEPGTILGHEIAGVVRDAGDDDRWTPGTSVVARPFFGCGACRHCRAGRQDHCTEFALVGLDRPGGFAELVAVGADELFALPAEVTGDDQALVEPLAIARRALRRVDLQRGERVAVLGGGPIGLAAVLWAKALGAAEVLVSEPHPARRELALALGADRAVDPSELAAAAVEADGTAPPVVLECSGRPGVIDAGMQVAEVEGRVGVIGICTAPDTIFPWWGLSKELDVRFSIYYGHEDFTDTLEALGTGAIDPTGFVTETIGLDELPARFAALAAAPDGGKTVLRP